MASLTSFLRYVSCLIAIGAVAQTLGCYSDPPQIKTSAPASTLASAPQVAGSINKSLVAETVQPVAPDSSPQSQIEGSKALSTSNDSNASAAPLERVAEPVSESEATVKTVAKPPLHLEEILQRIDIRKFPFMEGNSRAYSDVENYGFSAAVSENFTVDSVMKYLDKLLVDAGCVRGTDPELEFQSAVLFPTSRIVIFGLGGDDDLRINGTTIPGYIDGGPDDDIIRGGNGPDLLFGRGGDDTIYGRNGDDTIYGGSGNDILESNGGIGFLFGEGNSDTLTGNGILVGGNGSDELNGTGARNVLIGGNGADLLTGANANQGDIIIAGITIHDSNLIALKAIRDEWKEPTPVNDRINHLNGTTPGGLNVPYYLNVASVFLDNASDTIFNFGSTNPTRDDWIFKSPNDIKVNPPGIVVTILNSPPAMMSIQSFGSSNLESGQFNSNQPSDVNGDGFTTPLDVLMIINHLNTSSQSPAVNGLAVGAFLDTNNDGAISPLDAPVVINWLNQLSRFVSDDTPDDDSQFGEVDSVFGLLSEGEADLMDFWAGTDTELESSIHSLTFGTTKRRRR